MKRYSVRSLLLAMTAIAIALRLIQFSWDVTYGAAAKQQADPATLFLRDIK